MLKTKSENKRLEANQRALIERIDFYRTSDSLSAASVEQMTLKHKEFERYYNDLATEAEALKIKVKRLEAASRTVTETVYKFETRWRDSIVYRDGRIDTVQCVSWKDPFLTFEMCERNGTATPYIAVTDTLVQFVHRVPRKFLFVKFGINAIRQEVLSKNPHTEIVFTEYIKLVK